MGLDMAYHKTRKRERINSECRRMRDGKARKKAQEAAELGPRPVIFQPPKLRRIVVVVDMDFGFRVEVFRFFRTNRITSYLLEHKGRMLEGKIGWTNFCKRLSAHYPALLSPMAE